MPSSWAGFYHRVSLGTVKSILWILLFVVGAIGVVVPCIYFYAASQLPPLESEFDLEKLLKFNIEGERMSVKMGVYARETGGIEYEHPDFAKLPKDLVAVYISQRGCPTFFQTPREEGSTWGWRMVLAAFGGQKGGDGWCEQTFAARLAERVGAATRLQIVVGTHKIHTFLKKDQLIAYDLSQLQFEPAVVGVEAACQKLFHKKLEQLQLSEISELELALPPFNFYEQLRDCRNPSLIRQNRDYILNELARDGLVPEDRAKNAQGQPVACTLLP
jgi:hypothetical protein